MDPGPPLPTAPAGGPRVFRRSSTDRYLGGVAGGIGERLATDPVYVRLGLVAASLYLAYNDDRGLHPLVLVPYAVLWAVVPGANEPSLVRRVREPDARRELLLVVAALACGILLLSRPSSIIVLALGGLAVALLRDRPPGPDVDADEDDVAASPAATRSRSLLPRPLVGGHERRARREPALWPLTVALLVVVGMVGLAADRASDDGVDPRIVVDVALLGVGAVLLLSAWRGRARITLLAAVALLPAWVATSVPDVGRFAGEGTVTERPTVMPASSTLAYEVGYGSLDVDLRALPMADGSETVVELGLTAGRATVLVPPGARIAVRGTVGLGVVEVDAPTYYRYDADPAVNRSLDRTYPALGVECDEVTVPDVDLPGLAERAGISAVDDAGRPLSFEEVADAIAAAGYPRPVEQADEWGDRLAGAVERPDGIVMAELWHVQLNRDRSSSLCRPEPPPDDPATIVIEPTIGFGTLRIRRG